MRWSLAFIASIALPVSITSAAAPTFNKDVAPIVFNHCTSCHRPGEIGPFALMNYNDVKKRARQIADVTEDKLMPPWKATEDYGHFVGERRLSKQQIETIQAWVASGMAEGDAKDLPKMPKFPEGWQMGEPDLVVKMDETFEVPAEGRDVYRAFVLPLNLSEDKYVRAVEFRPSNRRVTHHALFFLDDSGRARQLDARDEGPGYKSFGGPGFTPSGGLGGWAPGSQPQELPDGVARMIRKGSDLVLQMHFHPTGKVEKEQPTIGIYFTKKRPERILAGFALLDRKLDIPAGARDFVARDEFELPIDMQITGVTPHAHLLGKGIKAWATLPDGKIEPLIEIKSWDFDWQEQYVYRKPLDFPKGTKLTMEFHYDNSSSNPANPSNPPQRVRWGEQTTDEMAILFISGVAKNMNEMPDLIRATRRKLASSFGSDPAAAADLLKKQILERFDKDGDGQLNAEERAAAIKAAIEAKQKE